MIHDLVESCWYDVLHLDDVSSAKLYCLVQRIVMQPTIREQLRDFTYVGSYESTEAEIPHHIEAQSTIHEQSRNLTIAGTAGLQMRRSHNLFRH
jgi:hypothetical protein